MDITPEQRRALRARAHHLHPVVSVGQHGLTPQVLHEIDVALKTHELIKIRVHSDDRDAREAMLADIAAQLDAAPVQHLGKLLIVWREREAQAAPPPAAARPVRRPAKGKRRPRGAPATPLTRGQAKAGATLQRRRWSSDSPAAGVARKPAGVARKPAGVAARRRAGAPEAQPAGLPRRRRAR